MHHLREPRNDFVLEHCNLRMRWIRNRGCRRVRANRSVSLMIVLMFIFLFDVARAFTPLARKPTVLSNLNMLKKNRDGIHTDASTSKQQNISTDPVLSRSSFVTSAALSACFLVPMAAAAMNPNEVKTSTTSDYTGILPGPMTIIAESETNSLQESISGFVAGAALAGTKTLVKYPLDTVTVRLQVPGSEYSIKELGRLFSGSFNGVTLSLLSNIPGGAVFFAVKDAAKAGPKNSALSSSPRWLTTTVAVGAALIPYWIVRNPSEVIKVRQQAGIKGYGDGVSAWDALQLTYNETIAEGGSFVDGISTFYTGYWENIIYGLPADVIKFVAYETITGGRKDLSALEGAKAGALATATAQLVTTPFDVIRNRLMTRPKNKFLNSSDSEEDEPSKSYPEMLLKLGRQEGIHGLFAGASPRVAKAFLSGAVQFATYEETKRSITRLLTGQRDHVT